MTSAKPEEDEMINMTEKCGDRWRMLAATVLPITLAAIMVMLFQIAA